MKDKNIKSKKAEDIRKRMRKEELLKNYIPKNTFVSMSNDRLREAVADRVIFEEDRLKRLSVYGRPTSW